MPNSSTSRMSTRIREASELRRVRSGLSGTNAETSTTATNIFSLNTNVRTTVRTNSLASNILMVSESLKAVEDYKMKQSFTEKNSNRIKLMTNNASFLNISSRNSPLSRMTASRNNRRATGIPSTLLETRNSPGRTEQLGVRSRLSNMRSIGAKEETRSSAKNIEKKRADKQVQTDKNDELVRIPLNLITKRDRSLSPAQLPCAICFNEMLPTGGRRLTSLKCGHTFCHLCVEKWYEICKSCPVCMQPMNKKSFRNVYF